MLRPIRRRALLALLVLPLAALAGCGEYATEADSDDIRGVWVAQGSGATVYLEISSDAVAIYYSSLGNCFQHSPYDIVNRTGDTYTLALPGTTFTADLIMRRSGDQLEVRDPEDPNTVAYYDRSGENLAELELCAGGGSDPDIVCTDLPRIDVGESVTGSLSTTDPVSDFETYFDLYGLQLTTSQRVTIDLRSTEIDSYLVVYNADGGQIAENDDVSNETLDASLTLDLGPGCYRIEATSREPEETGQYTLSVN